MRNKAGIKLTFDIDQINEQLKPHKEHQGRNYAPFQTCACFDKACDEGCTLLLTVGELGSGNGGTVSEVFSVREQRIWAKKVIATEKYSDKSEIRRILNEIEALKRQDDSPYVTKTYGGNYLEKNVVCYMEFMDMGSLDKVLNGFNLIPEKIVSRIIRHVVSGLDYLYTECGIAHKDVKPSNILLNLKGNIKLCDFGISVTNPNPDENKQYFGTIAYMSPERLRYESGDRIEQQGDIWSLGITVIELAIGIYPFPMPSCKELKIIFKKDPEGKLGRFVGRSREKDSRATIFDVLPLHNEKSPNLPSELFSPSTIDFIDICLQKTPAYRKSYPELIKHSFLHLDKCKEKDGDQNKKNNAYYFEWLETIKLAYTKYSEGGVVLGPFAHFLDTFGLMDQSD